MELCRASEVAAVATRGGDSGNRGSCSKNSGCSDRCCGKSGGPAADGAICSNLAGTPSLSSSSSSCYSPLSASQGKERSGRRPSASRESALSVPLCGDRYHPSSSPSCSASPSCPYPCPCPCSPDPAPAPRDPEPERALWREVDAVLQTNLHNLGFLVLVVSHLRWITPSEGFRVSLAGFLEELRASRGEEEPVLRRDEARSADWQHYGTPAVSP
eukprot:RCo000397